VNDQEILADIEAARRFAFGMESLGADLKAKQGGLQADIAYMIDLFLGRHDIGMPEDRRFVAFDVKSSRPADIIFRVLSALAEPVRLSYITVGNSSRERERAAQIDAHLNALQSWFSRSSPTRYDLAALFWQLLVGRSYIQQSYIPYYWDKQIGEFREGEEDNPAAYLERIRVYKARKGPPVLRETLDPRMVFPVYGPGGIRAYVKIYRVARYEFERNAKAAGLVPVYGQDGLPTQLIELADIPEGEYPESTTAPASSITYYEYIDDEWIVYAVDKRVLYRHRHGGSIAIFPAYGLQTGLREVEYQSFGLLWPVRNEIPQLDFYRTLVAQKAYLDVFPPLVAQLREGETMMRDESGLPKSWELVPGTITQIQGELRNALREAASSMDLLTILNYLAGEIDLATIPTLLRGSAPQYQAGYSVNQMIAATRTHWKPFIQSRENQEASLAEHYLTIVKHHIKQSVIAYGEVMDDRSGKVTKRHVEISPDVIDDIPRVDAQTNIDLPVDRAAAAQLYWNLHKEGGATWEDYVKLGLGKMDPENYRKQAERDAARRQLFAPAMQAATALARVKLVNSLIAERGLDKANVLLTADIESLLEGLGEAPGAPPPSPVTINQPGAPLPVNPSLGQVPNSSTGQPQMPGAAPNSLGPGSAARNPRGM
jgi:hypothetical protein